jgi:hypothetical protein
MSSAPARTGPARDASERIMSWSAYDLQVRATARSASGRHPGLVPDDYLEHLDDLGLQATITAAELCSAGLWERAAGGYRILDRTIAGAGPDQARQATSQDLHAPAREPGPEATDWGRLAEPGTVTPPCAACGSPAARIELVAPGQLPSQWDHWPGDAQATITRLRQPGQWHLIVAGPVAGNGYGDPIDTTRAGQIAWAFRAPLRYTQVRTAGFPDDAGFCPACDAPYCHEHWHVSQSGHRRCPYDHGRSLDPHPSPLATGSSSAPAPASSCSSLT